MDLVGQELGHIRILEKLGEGGMGEVYVGFDQTLERKVAVKALHRSRQYDENAVQRLKREATVLSQLEHPNISRIYELVETPDGYFLVLELIQGENLRQAMKSGLDKAEKVEVAIQVARALEAAHAKNVVHRDLKPDNIMLDKAGQVKVLDFGLAHMLLDETKDTVKLSRDRTRPVVDVMDNPSPTTFRTQCGTITGTPMFMSPEHALGENVGTSSDLFSFGLVLQWLFTEQFPYPKDTEMAHLVKRVTRGESLPVEGLPSNLTDLINRLKSFQPQRRPTALYALEKLIWIKGKKARVAKRGAIAAILFLLIAGTTLSTYGFLKARKEADMARETTSLLQEFLNLPNPGKMGRDAKVIDLLTAFEPRLKELEEKPEIQAELFYTFAATYRDLADYEKAVEYASDSFRLYKEKKGSKDIDTLDAQILLGTVLIRTGEHQRAEMILRKAAQVGADRFGREHAIVNKATYPLAVLLENMGKYAEAEEIVREGLLHAQKRLGKNHQHTLLWEDSLFELLYDKRAYDEAITLGESILVRKKALLGEDHPHVLAVSHNLAIILQEMGEIARAEALMKENCTKIADAYGEDHPSTLRVKRAYARLIWEDREDLVSKKIFVEVYEKRREILGETHPETLNAHQDVIDVMEYEKNPQAIPMQLEMVRKASEQLGEKHRTTMFVRHRLGIMLRDARRYEEAETLFDRLHADYAETIGETHPKTMGVLDSYLPVLFDSASIEKTKRLAAWYFETETAAGKVGDVLNYKARMITRLVQWGRYHDAEELIATVLAMQTLPEYFENKDPRLADVLKKAGASLVVLGKYELAIAYLEDAVSRTKDYQDDTQHLQYLESSSMLNLARAYQGEPIDAESNMKKMAAQYAALNPKEIDTAERIDTALARILILNEKYGEAEKVLRSIVEIEQRVWGPEHPRTADALYQLATFLRMLGKMDDSASWMKKAAALGHEKAQAAIEQGASP